MLAILGDGHGFPHTELYLWSHYRSTIMSKYENEKGAKTHLGSGISPLEGFFTSVLDIDPGDVTGKCTLFDLLFTDDNVPKLLVAVGDIQLFPISLLYLMLVYSLPSCMYF